MANEVNATRLDMKLMAQRKNLGLEKLEKVMVGKLEKDVRASMKRSPSGYPGVDTQTKSSVGK